MIGAVIIKYNAGNIQSVLFALERIGMKAEVTDDIEKIRLADKVFKVPQIGWNSIYDLKTGLFREVKEDSFCYFVHSYYASMGEHTIATTNYVQPYSSALKKDNFYGVQFHPEKSAEIGEKILRNFLTL